VKTPRLSKYHRDPAGFIDAFIRFNEKGQAWSLNRHQRRVLAKAFQWDADGQLLFRILLWGEMKKSGKTFLAACLILYWAFVTPNTEIIVAANDLEQSVSLVFRTIVNLIKYNPELSQSCKIRSTEIHFSNSTIVTAISSDYKGAAGSRHSLVVFDELWGYTLESAQRLFEELTPPPTESNAWILVVSTAGWVGESTVLEGFYKQGLAGERIDDDLELFKANELFMFWSHTPRQPWQTPEYYDQQRRILRPATFQRLHENTWVTNENLFLTPELFDPCVDAALTPLL